MTQQVSRDLATAPPVTPPARISARTVLVRRGVGVLVIVVPLLWATRRALPPDADLVNRAALPLLDDLLATALRPSLDPEFLRVVLDAARTTLVFAILGTAGALVIGLVGGLVLSDIAWDRTPPWPVRMLRLVLRGILVATRAIHELIWALLFVSVLGLDPLVAVLAIALPFGAQTAKVFAEILDAVPDGPLRSLRNAGSRRAPALAFALLPGAMPLLLSYSFYRFECALRSSVLLGVVGVGGLGQELVVSLQSRNWNEVWTLVAAVLVLSAVVDLWSTRVRSDLASVTGSDWSGEGCGVERERVPLPGERARRGRTSRWVRWSAVVVTPGVALAWIVSGVSLGGLTSDRTRDSAIRLLQELWPPTLPQGGWPVLIGGVLDTVAMAILAMAIAVSVTLAVGPWATRPRPGSADEQRPNPAVWLRGSAWLLARLLLLVLRSVPPNIWAIVALLVLFPGVLPGALALGLYTGGILARLVAESWESVDIRPRDALRRIGVGRGLASVVSMTPPSAHHLLTYTLYRFEICVRDTAVVGVVGAAGLGRLFAENLSVFNYPVVTSLLLASIVVSVAMEMVGRRLRQTLRA